MNLRPCEKILIYVDSVNLRKKTDKKEELFSYQTAQRLFEITYHLFDSILQQNWRSYVSNAVDGAEVAMGNKVQYNIYIFV